MSIRSSLDGQALRPYIRLPVTDLTDVTTYCNLTFMIQHMTEEAVVHATIHRTPATADRYTVDHIFLTVQARRPFSFPMAERRHIVPPCSR